MNTFSVGECFRFAWELFKKRPGFFIAVMLITSILTGIISHVFPAPTSQTPSSVLGLTLAAFLIGLLIEAFIKMATIRLVLKAHDDAASAQISDLWYPQWQTFLYYIGGALLSGIMIAVGFILLIIPGIYLSLRFMFVTYLVVDKNMSPIDAIKESSRITNGHKWQLLGLMAALVGINIVGAILLLVGLLVTIPLSMLIVAHAYRVLEARANAVATA